MKQSRKKKNNKIRIIILEGESDKHFFKELKKQFDIKKFDISPLLKEGLNFKKINREVKASIEVLEYKEVWLVMDLKTRKPGSEKDYTTKHEIIADYRMKIQEQDKVDYIVMVLDLECWLLLYFSRHNNTETIKNSKKKLKKVMGIRGSLSETITVKRLMKKTDFWEKLLSNKGKNKSFLDFSNKIGIDIKN